MNLINNIHKIAFRGDTQTAAPVDKDLQAVPTPIKEESLQRTPQKDTFTTTTTKVPEYSAPTATKPVSTSIFYINDIHGRIGNMARIYTAKAEYDSQMVNSTSDKFVLSAGDISAGADNHIIKAANTYMSGMGLDATSDGNHEYDANPPEIAEMKKDAKFRSLGMNLIIPKGNPLEGIIEKSYIAEKKW